MANEYDSMGAGGEQDSPPAPAPDGGDKNSVVLSADHFPEGMAPKEGDRLTFCVTGTPDSEGNITGYFERASAPETEETGKSWEDGVRKKMSPMASQSDAA